MAISVSTDKGRIVHVTGEIDYSNVAELDAALDAAIEECPEGFIVDLSGTTYMDSGGVQSVLSAYVRSSERQGRLLVVLQHPNIKEIIGLIRPEYLPGFCMYDDIPSAKRALAGET